MTRSVPVAQENPVTAATVLEPAAEDPDVADDRELVRPPRRNRAKQLARIGIPVVFAVAAIALWQLVVKVTGQPAYLVPGPLDVLDALRTGASDLVEPTIVTIEEAYLGFLLAAVSGFAVALVMARWRVAELGVYPYLVILQTVPIIAVAPIFVVWFGAGNATNIIIAAMLAVFPIAANTLQGLRSTDRNLVQLYRMAGAPPRTQLFSLRIPHAVPQIMTGLKIGASSAAIGAIVGEFAAGIGGGAGGLGYAVTRYANQLQTPQLFAAVIVASVIALVLFGLVTLIEWLLLHRWHESATPQDE
ncbi:ABC transporter permease [Nocardia sp. CA2R105]|uniref:ABC transporter permease n=1 Tax=Nocardia coffeae TaxID=2873381 RepID=UPI001CA6D20C|nr:ABC transporter permease [Nocardia coffeae]MBY8860290.1 ABC transporter permease [Nocardia coffeae]